MSYIYFVSAAQHYHAFGFNALPVAGKAPAAAHGRPTTWRRWQTVRQTPEDLEQLPWPAATGLALISGPVSDGLACVDFDHAPDRRGLAALLEALDLPAAYPWIERSPGGGLHLWLRSDKAPEAARLDRVGRYGGHIELRLKDTITVVATSGHPNGGTYAFEAGALPGTPPACVALPDLLAAYEAITVTPPSVSARAPSRPGPSPAPRPHGLPDAALAWPSDPADWLAAAVAQALPGGRHTIGQALALRLRAASVSVAEAESMLRAYAARVPAGDHPYTVDEALASLRWAYDRPPGTRPPLPRALSPIQLPDGVRLALLEAGRIAVARAADAALLLGLGGETLTQAELIALLEASGVAPSTTRALVRYLGEMEQTVGNASDSRDHVPATSDPDWINQNNIFCAPHQSGSPDTGVCSAGESSPSSASRSISDSDCLSILCDHPSTTTNSLPSISPSFRKIIEGEHRPCRRGRPSPWVTVPTREAWGRWWDITQLESTALPPAALQTNAAYRRAVYEAWLRAEGELRLPTPTLARYLGVTERTLHRLEGAMLKAGLVKEPTFYDPRPVDEMLVLPDTADAARAQFGPAIRVFDGERDYAPTQASVEAARRRTGCAYLVRQGPHRRYLRTDLS